jgi:hypothetical protein
VTDDPTLTAATALRRIVDLYADLHAQAVARAASHDLPGGQAMYELGPVANVGAVELRHRAEEADWLVKHGDEPCEPCTARLRETKPDAAIVLKACCEHRFNPWDEDPETTTTLRWWTEEYRARTRTVIRRWTAYTEASWLTDNLRWVYDNEPHWSDFERDLSRAVSRLEVVLKDGDREERSWVPCIDCEVNRDGEPITVRLVRSYGRHESEDDWLCPRCKRRYDRTAFNQAQAETLRKHTTEEKIA